MFDDLIRVLEECIIGGRDRPGFKALITYEPEQAIIRDAQAFRAEGFSLRAVAARLASQGYCTRAGRSFAPVQVARMVAT